MICLQISYLRLAVLLIGSRGYLRTSNHYDQVSEPPGEAVSDVGARQSGLCRHRSLPSNFEEYRSSVGGIVMADGRLWLPRASG